MESKKMPINEIYCANQGEGKLTGIPHIIVRFSGCPLRCVFSGGSICDSATSSFRPEKAKYTLEDIQVIIEQNPQINHVMITGGSPTMHGENFIEVVKLFENCDFHITLETEGTNFTNQVKIDLLSLSPKLSNSIAAPNQTIDILNRPLTANEINRHEINRKDYISMKNWIQNTKKNGGDIQIKFVVSNEDCMSEIYNTLFEIGYEIDFFKQDVLLMPEGSTRKQILDKSLWLEDLCLKTGHRFCTRLHVIHHDEKRYV